MTISHTFDPQSEIFEVEVIGETPDQEWRDWFETMRNDERIHEHLRCLIDVRENQSAASTTTVRGIINDIEQLNRKLRVAVLVKRAVAVGMVNMASVLIERKNIELKAFKERKPAVRWLVEVRRDRPRSILAGLGLRQKIDV